MRSTIKVFVKTWMKKREASLAAEAKESVPPTPVDSEPSTQAKADVAALSNESPIQAEDVRIGKAAGVPASAEITQDNAASANPPGDGPENLADGSREVRCTPYAPSTIFLIL
jgi:hypothetical protein